MVFRLVIHGGAGTILKKDMTSEKEEEYRTSLLNSLLAGYEVLEAGGSAIDAVQASVVVMENCPLFNAGKGSVFIRNGSIEMDAAIMSGNGEAGAVCSVKRIKNPIKAARCVLDKSKHVLLSGNGADEFAEANQLEMADISYFRTDFRWNQLQNLIQNDICDLSMLDHDVSNKFLSDKSEQKFGTVGAVALDSYGNLAAATSTGGTMMKIPGRVGDSPIIGAGTYANNKTCGVSCTGFGEVFLKNLVAYDLHARMDYCKADIKSASVDIISKLKSIGGDGGLISISSEGTISMPFNTSGMYRGVIKDDRSYFIGIYETDEKENNFLK